MKNGFLLTVICAVLFLESMQSEPITIHLNSGTTLIGEIQMWDGEKGIFKTEFGEVPLDKKNLTTESINAISEIPTIGSPLNIKFKSGSFLSGVLVKWDGQNGTLKTEVGEINFDKDKVSEELLPMLAKITSSSTPSPKAKESVEPSPTPQSTPTDPVAYQKSAKYAVIVEGKDVDGSLISQGSGFLVRYKGKIYLFTNIHVISGANSVTAKGMNGRILTQGNLMVANNCDLAAIELPYEKDGLEILDSVDSNLQLKDQLAILGNSLGGRVTTEIRGQVSAIGPNLVETDAKFVHGNSGSPAIDMKTGKVVAIASYAETPDENNLTKDSQFNKTVRRYCYRLDTVDEWTPIPNGSFVAETSYVKAAENKNEDLYNLIYEIVVNKKILVNYNFKCKKSNIERVLQAYIKNKLRALETPASRNNTEQFINMAKSFFAQLSSECLNDTDVRMILNYDREKMKEICATRVFLKNQLDIEAYKLQTDPNFYMH